MKLLTQELEEKFKQYPLGSQDGKMGNAELIAKFFNPTGVGTWYITEGSRLENGDYEMFGYCHLGDDEFAEFGSILLSELENIELPLGLSIEQDLYVPKRTDLMTAMIRDGMRVPDFIKDNYIASDRCNFESIIILQPNLTDEEKSKVVNDYKEYFKKISAQEVEDKSIPVVCGLCQTLIVKLEDFLLGGAIDKAKEYIEQLCTKADGFIEKICTAVTNFGIDKLFDVIIEKGSAKLVCGLIHLC